VCGEKDTHPDEHPVPNLQAILAFDELGMQHTDSPTKNKKRTGNKKGQARQLNKKTK
jgi:hypothetical protein